MMVNWNQFWPSHPKSFARRSCSLSSQSASSSSSCEQSRSSRAITESSLSFTTGDFCSSVSEQRNKPAEHRYLMKFQEHVERRLEGRAISVNDEGNGKLLTVNLVI